jgi:hypothetical protein
MPKLDCDPFDFIDVSGQLRIIRGCPLNAIADLDYAFRRLWQEISKYEKPLTQFPAIFQQDEYVRLWSLKILELCRIDPGWVNLHMLSDLVIDPAHLYRINFETDERESKMGDRLTILEYVADRQAALVNSGQVQDVIQALDLGDRLSSSQLDAILKRNAKQRSPSDDKRRSDINDLYAAWGKEYSKAG